MKPLTLMTSLLVLAAPATAQEPPGRPVPWANKFFTGTPDNPPPAIIQNFGVLPRGTIKQYRFKMTNLYALTMQVDRPQAECGCVSVEEYSAKLQPQEAGYIGITLNTSQVEGEKTIKLPVRFTGFDPNTGQPVIDPKTKRQFQSQAELEIKFVSRADIAINPGAFQFGQVPAGQKASRTVVVTYNGRQPDWEIREIGIRKDLFDAVPTRVKVAGVKAAYEVKLTLKPDVPTGRLDEHIELKTNEPGGQTVLNLAVNGLVQAPLSIVNGDHRELGGGDVGQKVDHNVTIQAETPFKITAVEGTGDGVTVAPLLPVAANKVQFITVTFAPEKPGRVTKELTIKTNTGKSVKLTVEGIGKDPQ